MELRIIDALRRLNRGIALVVGLGLLGCAAFVLADILLRQAHASFGGTEEIAGYAMALATSWGMSYALLELGHVRIDLLRTRLPSTGRALFDLLAMVVTTAVIVAVAIKAWPVVDRSLTMGSRANTPLETPLALVQLPWFLGWVWFALMSCIVTMCALRLVLKGRASETESFVGAFAEQETLE